MAHGLVTPGRTFRDRTARALEDPGLQQALRNLDVRLGTAAEVERDHRALKDRAAAIRRETLADLDGWLDRLEGALVKRGVTVHRCATPAEARGVVADVARRVGAHVVVKSKSMATEEIDLAEALEAVGFDAVETDLGEYVVQVAGERPSHIITPVIHKTLEQVATVLSEEAGETLPVEREALTDWVRTHLRQRFLDAGLGVTGANFAVAETGTLVIVTNEGNGRFCTALPRVHVAVVPVEKVIPRFMDLATLLPVLTRSATGQRLSNYVSMISGPRRAGEHDGPEELHVVLLDHGRRRLIGTPYEAMLACIRCGACLNVCPVYRRVGGHAYDSVYPGPMGEVLTPLLSAGLSGRDLPSASTLCGACTEACPVEIPLADLIARLRADLRGPDPVAPGSRRPRLRRSGFGLWARTWSSPRGYRLSTTVTRVLGASRGPDTPIRWRRRLPGLGGWTATRDLPAPARRRFRDQWSSRS
jgi:L-lactate dehydrogenase complex protein LldF